MNIDSAVKECKTVKLSLFRVISLMFSNSNDPIDILSRLMKIEGNDGITLLKIGVRRIYFITNPDMIQECLVSKHKHFHKARSYAGLKLVMGQGLVTSEGDFHHRQRRMIQPAFLKDRINEYATVMGQYASDMCDAWQDGEEMDINRAMNHVTLNIVGKALFNSDVESEAGMVGNALDTLMNMDGVFLNPYAIFISKLPIPINKRRIKATEQLDSVVYKMIDEHRQSGDQGDLLSMLLSAQDEDDGGQMNDLQVRDEAVTLFLAGHETTANGLTWLWMNLAKYPEIEAKVHEEVDQVLNGRVPTADDYGRLDYTRRTFMESMRLYPPVWSVGRGAIQDTTLCGHKIHKNAEVIMSQFITQRDPRLFEDPLKFDPDRWLPEKIKERPKFSYFPFGGGKRLCIGEGFAWMEAVLVTAAVAQRYKLKLKPDFKEELDPHVTLRPKNGLYMIAEKR